MKTIDIYGIGGALVDIEFRVTDAFLQEINLKKGGMSLVDMDQQKKLIKHLENRVSSVSKKSGGSVCNSLVASSNLGSSTFFSGKYGSDELGITFVNDLKLSEVQCSAKKAATRQTGSCVVLLTPDAERTLHTYLGESENLSLDDIDCNALKKSKYLFIEGYLAAQRKGLKAAVEAARIAKHNDVKIVISLSDVSIVTMFEDGLKEMMKFGVDILFSNREEAIQFTKTNNLSDALDSLKKNTRSFVVTDGADGAWIYDSNSTKHIPAVKTKAIDTNGAGDIFAGSFLHCLCHGKTFKSSAEVASFASSLLVSSLGPRLPASEYRLIKKRFSSFV